MGLNPEEHSDFVSLAYAGSHIRDSISKDDILSFFSWLDYISVGSDFMKAALNRKTSAHQPFWNSVAQNMTPEGLQRFETLLKKDVPPSFEYTVESFGENSYYDNKKDPESTLYVIAYGADDYIVDDAIPDNVLETLRTGLEILIVRDKAIPIVINHLSQFNQLPAMKQLSKERLQAVQHKISLHDSKLEFDARRTWPKIPRHQSNYCLQWVENGGSIPRKKYKSGALSYCG